MEVTKKRWRRYDTSGPCIPFYCHNLTYHPSRHSEQYFFRTDKIPGGRKMELFWMASYFGVNRDRLWVLRKLICVNGKFKIFFNQQFRNIRKSIFFLNQIFWSAFIMIISYSPLTHSQICTHPFLDSRAIRQRKSLDVNAFWNSRFNHNLWN